MSRYHPLRRIETVIHAFNEGGKQSVGYPRKGAEKAVDYLYNYDPRRKPTDRIRPYVPPHLRSKKRRKQDFDFTRQMMMAVAERRRRRA